VTHTDVTVRVTNTHEGFESGTLTGAGLFLDGHNLHYFVFQTFTEKVFYNLVLLDGQREQENIFQALNLASFDQTAKLGDGHPFTFVTITTTTTTASTIAATTSTTIAATITATTKTTSKTTTITHYLK